MTLREQFLELLRTDPAFREEVRRLVLTEELLALPQKIDKLVQIVQELVEAQRQHSELLRQHSETLRKHSEQIAALIEAQRRTEEQIAALTRAQQRTWEELRRIADWQRGEAGRREGERYERQVIRRAPIIFNGGQGGPPDQPLVQQKLTELLLPFCEEGLLAPEEDPLLADLLWWKGEKVAVVEISVQVDRYDVERAAQRAEMLQRAGALAFGVVIGKEWATSEALEEAQRRHIEWLIGSEMSEGFFQFRQTEP